LSEKLNEIICK